MSPLENLFNIIQKNKEKTSDDTKSIVRVSSSSSSSVSRSSSESRTSSTSSSSSRSSSSSPSSRPSRFGSHGKKKKIKKTTSTSGGSASEPELQQLSPQERLVKKVKETLRTESSQRGDSQEPSNRKKVIIRKEIDNEEDSNRLSKSRISRQFRPGRSQIKSVKVRVRRIDEIPPHPVVY